jgi:hypothetical protein
MSSHAGAGGRKWLAGWPALAVHAGSQLLVVKERAAHDVRWTWDPAISELSALTSRTTIAATSRCALDVMGETLKEPSRE